MSTCRQILLTSCLLPIYYVAAAEPQNCPSIQDDKARLACFDAYHATSITSSNETRRAQSTEEFRRNLNSTIVADGEPVEVATVLDKYWELTAAEKRDRFVFRSYLPSFFLPVHFTSNINSQPQSPGKELGPSNNNYRQLEAKLQMSLRTKLATGVLLPNADIWFAFTQRSMWQLWNAQDSAPFRSTDYQPELIYIIPLSKSLGELGDGWRIRLLQLGIAHQSNGQSEPFSRSWNKIYGGLALDKGEFGLNWRYHQRISEDLEDDDNPDLIDYIGSHELTATWLPGLSTAMLVWRNDLSNISQGSWQLDMSYPVDSSKLDGLRWHLQLFSGYGETLLDYNIRQHSVGIGVMLFNF